MTIHLVSTRRARNTQARDLASPPKKAKKEPKHERQHPTTKKHPSEGFGIAPKKGNKRTQARKAAPDEQETPKRRIWPPIKKGQKRTQTRKAAPDEQETPKRGIWHRPQKRQGSTWLDRGNLDRIWTFWGYKMVFHST